MEKEIPIFFSINNSYIPFLSVALLSIKEKTCKDNIYKIIVINSNSISEENKSKIKKELESDNFSIEFFDISPYTDKMSNALHTRDYYSKETYFRIFIAELYPKYDKALYLDSDIVVFEDIANLYNIDIGDNLLGAIPDQSVMYLSDEFKEYVENRIGVDKFDKYFNAGILILNLKKLREFRLQDKFIELLKAVKYDVAQDQDYLNALCKGKVRFIEEKWNTMSLPIDIGTKYTPSLIHYNLSFKPWIVDDVKYKDFFWEYAKKSVYYADILAMKKANTQDKQKDMDSTTIKLMKTTREQAKDTVENERIKEIVNKIIG